MGYLTVSIIVALAMAVSVYGMTASVLVAFIAYSGTGTLVLLSVLFGDGLRHGGQFNTTE